MNSFSRNQWLFIFGAVILTLLIYLIPRKIQTNEELSMKSNLAVPDQHEDHSNVYKSYLDSLFTKLSPQVKDKYQLLLAINGPAKFDSLIFFFKTLKQPFLVANWLKEKATIHNTAINWSETGKFYFIGFEFAPNQNVKHVAIEEATSAYKRAFDLDPSNPNYQIEYASCIMEGGGDNPMQGINMLREVLKKDSNNVAAQFKMGIFAVRSQQFEKAVARFNKVISLEPNNSEAILYLGECYANLGKRDLAIKTLEIFKKKSNDAIINAEVDDFIEKLKNSNNN
jgi:tetratricopeptide (TPR) repeat protein